MRVLLVKTSSLGDVVHNLPVVTDIVRHLPGAVVDWIVEEPFAGIARLHAGVRRVIPVAVRRWRGSLGRRAVWSEMGEFRRHLRAEAYDAVIDTQGLLKSAVVARQARLARDGRRYGYGRAVAREGLAAHLYHRGYDIPRSLHAVERNRRLAAAALGYALDEPCDYGIQAVPLRAGWLDTATGGRPYAVLLTATSRAAKEWPEEHWRELMGLLDGLGWRAVLPAGSAAERACAARLAASSPAGIAAPSLDIAALAGLMAGACAVIGVDTGLVHLAAALDRPTVALFRASDPALTGVHAGPAAVNLGAPGRPPVPREVFETVVGVVGV